MSQRIAPDLVEGPEAFKRFDDAMKSLMKVPHAEIKKRMDAHREQAALNPKKRGPKKNASRVRAV